MQWECDSCNHHDHDSTHSHGHSHSHAQSGDAGGSGSLGMGQITALRTGSSGAASINGTGRGAATPLRFAVIGDTQGGEFGGHSNLVTRLMESVATHNVDYILFPGDLIANTGSSGWNAWSARTSGYGVGGTNLNQFGRDMRLMTPGNHDVGSGASAWQSAFSWLPDSQTLNGQTGIDQVDYYVDQGNVRFVSISSDAPNQSYNSRQIGNSPPALDWMREVMLDVDARNADANPDNNIDHVFTFSHRPVTTQAESPTGGTNGEWWESMTGQDAASGNHAATAFIPGHWHMYQPSRPDPRVDTMEIISGTGGGGLEGQAHRNRHGYSIISVNGGDVTSEFYGDFNQGSDNWNFQLLDSYTIAQTGGLPTGELARYNFESGAIDQDSSASALSKGHTLHFNGGASVFNDLTRGSVLQTNGSGAYVDAKDIGDNNLAVLGDLTISLFARADTLDAGVGENTFVAFGGADGSSNGSLNGQESANYAYRFSMTDNGNLQLSWQHDDSTWETITSNENVDDPTVWHEYKVQRDGSNMGVAFFVDGTQLGETFAADFLATGGGSGSLYIGSAAGGSLGFDGLIDDLRIDNLDVTLVPMILGDFDSDGDIDGEDWLLYVAGLGAASPGATDLTGDGFNNHDDFLRFQELYNNLNGAGSFSNMLAGVPEPSSIVLLLALISTLLVVKYRQVSRDELQCG